MRRAIGGAESPEPRACQAELLVFDDLGAEYHTDYGVSETTYVVHHRLIWCRPTILTTAMGSEEVVEKYGKSFSSRIKEFYHVRLPEALPDLREER